MPTNVEIKARVRDPAALAALARRLSDAPPVTLHQRDISTSNGNPNRIGLI